MSIERYESKAELAKALSRAKSAIQSAKKETKEIAGRTMDSVITVGTAYLVGLARNKKGSGADKKLLVPGTSVEVDLAGGVILSLVGISGFADEFSDELCSVGNGMLAANAAIGGFTHGLPGDNR